MPGWLEQGAETAVGVVILLLALRIVVKWLRGDFRAGKHPHRRPGGPRATATSITATSPSIATGTCGPRGRRSASACSTAWRGLVPLRCC